MKVIKENLGLMIICVIELIIGIVFFTDPVQFTAAVLMGVGVVLLVVGIGCVIRYFTTPPAMAVLEQQLAKGLISLLMGALLLFRNEQVVALFPLLTQIYGVVILITGMIKLQRGVDLLRLKRRFWHLSTISAVLAVLASFIILTDPFESTIVLWRVAAVTLIAQAVLDLVMLVLAAWGRRGEGNDYIIVE